MTITGPITLELVFEASAALRKISGFSEYYAVITANVNIQEEFDYETLNKIEYDFLIDKAIE